MRKVYGVGIYEPGKYLAGAGGTGNLTKGYTTWVHMLERCYSEDYQKKRPTYVGCSVSDGFKNFQTFMSWAETQVGFGVEGFQLDKDLLIMGNKIYSEDNCVFVPREVNALLIQVSASQRRGQYPVGISYYPRNNKFLVKVSVDGKRKHLGYFKDMQKAFSVYKSAKESQVKIIAERFKGVLDERVYKALMNYQVNIDN